MYRFRIGSYSPGPILIAEHMTVALMIAPFPRQPNSPSQLFIDVNDTFKPILSLENKYSFLVLLESYRAESACLSDSIFFFTAKLS